MGNGGELSWKMPDGEACKGRWSSGGGGGSVSFTSASLLTQYGPAYLSGYTVMSAAGWNRGVALATCTQGRVFELEFLSQGHGFGIGKDSDGNIYRFVF